MEQQPARSVSGQKRAADHVSRRSTPPRRPPGVPPPPRAPWSPTLRQVVALLRIAEWALRRLLGDPHVKCVVVLGRLLMNPDDLRAVVSTRKRRRPK